jgi:hypothetical protein
VKIQWPFESALRGIGGQFEITRVLGGFGALAYCVCVNAFVGWEVLIDGKTFELVAYCAAFPAGLIAIIGAAAGAASWKDKGVASAKVIETTGAVPAKPPAGPRVPTGEPPPAHDAEGEAR